MARGKTQLRRIENAARSHVTFTKRSNVLLKKAFELSLLCDVEVALIIFSSSGKLLEFASAGMVKTIERYRCYSGENNMSKVPKARTEQWALEIKRMARKIDLLEDYMRKIHGYGLESCPLDEVQNLEKQLEQSLTNIRGKKYQLLGEQIEGRKEKVKMMMEENVMLYNKCTEKEIQLNNGKQAEACDHLYMEVETELRIGRTDKATCSFSKG